MTGKPRLTQLANRISEKKKGRKASVGEPAELVANPAHGQRGGFLKLSVTVAPEVYELIAQEVTRRKVAREPNAQTSAVIREAVIAYLSRTGR